ncbi:MAG: putative DNA binding domain-containing protein, partial [ANME-2 cluster archaeon]|nr:putative DNA binding domain-containing protein [ANME-2 cluster archaeon]
MSSKENQTIEWKESWRDEYIRWICGFANAQGGTLIIGKNDKGAVVGVSNVDKLLEKIPNKIRDILGIIVDVNMRVEQDKELLEIVVEPYPYPISYKGEYHYRTGSTKQELKGAALDRFLLQKQGKHWDGVPMPRVDVAKFKDESFGIFRTNAAKSGRVSDEVLAQSNALLIDNLNLKEGDYLKRAAILLFHDNPEKWVVGSYIKIGFFRTDADLLYQDEIHGSLFAQAEKAMDLLLTKYMRATISYEGISRVEKYPFPRAALREAMLNAIVHKDYSGGSPIQISVYEDKIYFWNDGQLPDNWTVEQLLSKHASKPFNPMIANAFFRAGMIESWGRGIEKINRECEAVGVPLPEYRTDASGLMVKFHAKPTTTGKTPVETP